jgi:hypothetical protein
MRLIAGFNADSNAGSNLSSRNLTKAARPQFDIHDNR